MRVLASCVVGYGHFHPMVPLLRALVAAGHDVAVATDPGFTPYVRSLGFEAFPAGLDQREARARFLAETPEFETTPLLEQAGLMFPGLFARVRTPVMLADLEPLAVAWAPDLMIHDTNEFAAALVADRMGIAHAEHAFGILRPPFNRAAAARELAPIAAARGQRHPGIDGDGGEPFLDVCPPSLQTPEITSIPDVRPIRSVSFDDGASTALPDWFGSLPDRPVVYVTMGTVFNRDPSVFEAILAGLRDEPLELIVTLGADGDPAALGPQPDNVHVERFLPQGALLAFCDLVVSHCGSGAMLGTLGAGLPMLALPQGADQFLNASRITATGTGLALMPAEATPAAIREATTTLLTDASIHAAAQALRAEIEAMPAPASVVGGLEALVAAAPSHGNTAD